MWSRFAFLAALAVAGLFYSDLLQSKGEGLRDNIGVLAGLTVFLFFAASNWWFIDRNRRPPT